MKRLIRLVFLAGVVGAVVAALKRRPAPPSASPTAPPTTPGPTAAPVVVPPAGSDEAPPADPTGDPSTGWAEPTAGGGCPDGHPVKAKLKSRIFHVPGGALYERTTPDRCYSSAAAAEADGLRASLR